MYKVKIYGAGSIGNHLAHACRSLQWDVLICDKDAQALERTKSDIYPARYGRWDDAIRLCTIDQLPKEKFDLVIIGTPPDSHIPIALEVLKSETPKIILIEKPLCGPGLEGASELLALSKEKNVFVGIGYNHTLTQNTREATQILNQNSIGKPLSITAVTREHWKGIFSAHPWLRGPQDTYLGFSSRGGGATGEHSHAINIFQHFTNVLKLGRIVEVTANLNHVKTDEVSYDEIAFLTLKTEKGLMGNVTQDVITEPSLKQLRIQGSAGFLEWQVNFNSGVDRVSFQLEGNSKTQEKLISKTRSDDFKGEIIHIGELLGGTIKPEDSPISLERGLETMMVICATFISDELKRTVKINYEKGFNKAAISAFGV